MENAFIIFLILSILLVAVLTSNNMVVGKESFAVSRGRYLPDGDTLGPSLNEPTGIWRFREMTNTSNLESDQSCLLPGLNTLLFDGVGDVASSLI